MVTQQNGHPVPCYHPRPPSPGGLGACRGVQPLLPKAAQESAPSRVAHDDPPAPIRTATATPRNPERQRCAEGKRLHHHPPRLPPPKPLACGAPWRLVIILPRFLWESDPLFSPISQTRAGQANPKICLVGFLPNILKKDPAPPFPQNTLLNQ